MLGEVGKHDLRIRIASLRRGARAGDAQAMSDLGEWLLHGSHGGVLVRRNPRLAVSLLLRAASKGVTSAEFPLGYSYDVGLGIGPSKRAALRWYLRAWRHGSWIAGSNIAIVHRDRGNLRLAFAWWHRAAVKGSGDDAIEVGYCYQYGIGVRRSERLARRAYGRAIKSRYISERGREEAMYYLAVMYLDRGDTRAACTLLARAAADGDFSAAQFLLTQVRSKRVAIPCRCRATYSTAFPGHAQCLVHPRPRHGRRWRGRPSGP